MTRRYREGHLGEFVDAYVDGQLDETSSHLAARHIISCEGCRQSVEAERAIVLQVRRVPLDPGRHARLVAGLVALDTRDSSYDTPRGEAAVHSPAKEERVHLLSPDAPAQYNGSSRRPVLGMVALAAACGAIVMSSAAHPRSTAPGAPTMASNAQTTDHFDAPEVRGEGPRSVARSAWSVVLIQANDERSGRMAP